MEMDQKTLVYRWFDEVWNRGREETIDELFSPQGVAYGLGEGDPAVRGPAGFKIFWRNMRSALPDVDIRIEDTIVQGDKAVVRVVLEGTHTGEGLGVAPTGHRVHIAGMVMVRIAGDQIVEGWNSWDQLGLLQQIGAIPVQNSDRFLTARG
jgi:predicted ester cyclase